MNIRKIISICTLIFVVQLFNPILAQDKKSWKDLINDELAELPLNSTLNYHTHLLGTNWKKTGCYVNPKFKSKGKYFVFKAAAGVLFALNVDKQYIKKLKSRMEYSNKGLMKTHLFAFDEYYKIVGDKKADWKNTTMHVPNKRVFEISKADPLYFVPVISVHPYRENAADEVRHWAAEFRKTWPNETLFLKWLPNSMNIDPKRVPQDYLQALKDNNIVLITHTGGEGAVTQKVNNELGNPLELRYVLDFGIKVVMAHCASEGEGRDDNGVLRDSYRLYEKMMDEYKGLVFADISAVTQRNRISVLESILKDQDSHQFLINGSDYPLPNVKILSWKLISIKKLNKNGFLDDKYKKTLRKLCRKDILLFDLMLKRWIVYKDKDGNEYSFPKEVFMKNNKL